MCDREVTRQRKNVHAFKGSKFWEGKYMRETKKVKSS